MEIVTLKWYGPYNLERAHIPDVVYEKGIYLITRKWGDSEKLLYIGQTQRSLIDRIEEHKKYWLSDLRGFVQLRYGIIQLLQEQKFSPKKLSDIEALLIHCHQPQENTINMTFYNGRTKLTVINIGRRGPLCYKVTTDDLEFIK